MLIKDKVIAITGGGRGLGRAMALAFAERGGHVALLDLNQADLDETCALVKARGVRAAGYPANVTREQEVAAALDATVRDFGRLDVMINNAGITRDGLLVKAKDGEVVSKLSLEQWQKVIDVNLTGVFLGGREAAERMIRLGNGGVIINISSISRHGNMGQTNYSAAKAGVAAMTVVWAKELARYGIRAGAIAPGFCATEILSAMKPEILEKVMAPVPLRRLGEPEEVAHAAVFIAENDFFTGRVIGLDGGLRL
jgi:3-oxoacyl-[acyl-carrier protein] reductase